MIYQEMSGVKLKNQLNMIIHLKQLSLKDSQLLFKTILHHHQVIFINQIVKKKPYNNLIPIDHKEKHKKTHKKKHKESKHRTINHKTLDLLLINKIINKKEPKNKQIKNNNNKVKKNKNSKKIQNIKKMTRKNQKEK